MKFSILLILFSLNCFSQRTYINEKMYFEKDKVLHGTAGAWLGSSAYMFVHYKTDDVLLSTASAVLVAFGAGWLKENHDKNQGRRFSNEDLAQTTFGGFTGAFVKIIQIDIQTKNKELSREYKLKFQ